MRQKESKGGKIEYVRPELELFTSKNSDWAGAGPAYCAPGSLAQNCWTAGTSADSGCTSGGTAINGPCDTTGSTAGANCSPTGGTAISSCAPTGTNVTSPI